MRKLKLKNDTEVFLYLVSHTEPGFETNRLEPEFTLDLLMLIPF